MSSSLRVQRHVLGRYIPERVHFQRGCPRCPRLLWVTVESGGSIFPTRIEVSCGCGLSWEGCSTVTMVAWLDGGADDEAWWTSIKNHLD